MPRGNEIGPAEQNLLGPEKAPDNLLSRYGLLALKGVSHTPSGMWHAIEEDIHHPWQTLGMIAGSAAVGMLVKTVLPKCGSAGKVAGVAIGAGVAYMASEPIGDAFKIARQAKTMNDINVAGNLLGDVAGSFVVNSAISSAAYKLGSVGATRAFSLPRTEQIAAAANAGFWNRSVAYVSPRIPIALSVTTASSASMMFEPRLAGIERFNASEPIAPYGIFKGPTDENTQLAITVQLKSKASDQEMDQVLKDVALGKRAQLSDAEFAGRFGASQESLDQLTKFAQSYNLKVGEADLGSGRVVLSGTASEFSDAFKTELNEYRLNGMTVRDRTGALFVPKTVLKHIEGVFGLDDRPQARPHIILDPPNQSKARDAAGEQSIAYRADEVASAYNFPKGTSGKGQAAAIVELGGGFDRENESTYYKQNGLKLPDIKIIAINGATTNTGRNFRADNEVSLDSQILGTIAPDAKQTIIFTRNNEQGFIDAIGRGAFPKESETNNQAISISWGQPYEAMSEQGRRGMSLVLKKAALKGITVFVSAGDDGAADDVHDGKFHVDYPAADPYATGVGGTILSIKNGKINSEVAWNDSTGVTGGGISPSAAPDFQKDLILPTKGLSGRGVPDIAGNASHNTGYKIFSAGREQVSGGTSAVAPLYTALALRLNEGLAGTRTVGFMNPFLYEQGISGKATFYNDITLGNNNGYVTKNGWDPVTGWGSIDGEKILKAYKDTASRLKIHTD